MTGTGMWGIVLALAVATPGLSLPDTEPRRSATEFAVAVARKVDAVAVICATLPAPDGVAMTTAHAAWRARNQPLVDAALAWREVRYAAVAREKGAADVETERRNFEYDVEGIAGRGVARVAPGGTPDVTRCRAYVAMLEVGTIDLAAHAEFGPLLSELAAAAAGP